MIDPATRGPIQFYVYSMFLHIAYQYLVAEGGKVELAATCGMVAEYDVFSIVVEMLIEGFKVGI